MKITICIPARLKSSRFPSKVLADLNGKPVLQHVFERACSVFDGECVVILCDSEIVRKTAERFGARTIDTSENCVSGTERIASALDKIQGEFIINIQGDEPLFETAVIGKMIAKCQISSADIFTPIYKFSSMEDALNPNCVKVATGHDGRALYFSRSVIPFVRDEGDVQSWLKHTDLYGHVGIYGYRREVLENYKNLVCGKLEFVEKLEQLRFLENGYEIATVEAAYRSIGIDVPEDLLKAGAVMHDAQQSFGIAKFDVRRCVGK